ncbi:response regulator transcription factor [Cryobacterium sp. SO1]|uniref:response regulator transcription factor n=1 Tax=Cryobacterium sp. SO1 TaxID=1897061 RepID=UPI001022CEA1|nr:response regulator [Cryobacterium sp. SO1]RZI34378.1 Alkaline phosphatase synthesis transcriptional regulatory protein PhoP [Cryobacterium sp. SO1]
MPRILIVEDDEDVRALIGHKLRRAGHEVTEAGDGEEGLAAARAQFPDLIVLDWMMPKLTGIEVCAQVRADSTLTQPRILLLTAKSQDSDIALAMETGADAYLIKPFRANDLLERVSALLMSPAV